MTVAAEVFVVTFFDPLTPPLSRLAPGRLQTVGAENEFYLAVYSAQRQSGSLCHPARQCGIVKNKFKRQPRRCLDWSAMGQYLDLGFVRDCTSEDGLRILIRILISKHIVPSEVNLRIGIARIRKRCANVERTALPATSYHNNSANATRQAPIYQVLRRVQRKRGGRRGASLALVR